MQHWITSSTELTAYLSERYGEQGSQFLQPAEGAALDQTPYAFLLARYYADLIDWSDKSDPLRQIIVPQGAELMSVTGENFDPIGDEDDEVVPGLVHRYQDKVLLSVAGVCAGNCRFCCRKNNKVRGAFQNREDYFLLSGGLEKMTTYVQSQPQVQELIFSGGDPWTLSQSFWREASQQFLKLQQIKVWRWHTKVPVYAPDQIGSDWWQMFLALVSVLHERGIKTVVVLHLEHEREITAGMIKVVQDLQGCGVEIWAQGVLLAGVNDQAETLANLWRRECEWGIKPYYLYHLDQITGQSAQRVSIERGLAIFREAVAISGERITVPKYVLDLPAGGGKVSVASLQKVKGTEMRYLAVNLKGQRVEYQDLYGTV